MSQSSADLCRQRGWTVGSILAGSPTFNESERLIVVTAIGVEDIYAVGLQCTGTVLESPWNLFCREWRKIGQLPKEWTGRLIGPCPACGQRRVTETKP